MVACQLCQSRESEWREWERSAAARIAVPRAVRRAHTPRPAPHGVRSARLWPVGGACTVLLNCTEEKSLFYAKCGFERDAHAVGFASYLGVAAG